MASTCTALVLVSTGNRSRLPRPTREAAIRYKQNPASRRVLSFLDTAFNPISWQANILADPVLKRFDISSQVVDIRWAELCRLAPHEGALGASGLAVLVLQQFGSYIGGRLPEQSWLSFTVYWLACMAHIGKPNAKPAKSVMVTENLVMIELRFKPVGSINFAVYLDYAASPGLVGWSGNGRMRRYVQSRDKGPWMAWG